MSIDWLLDRMGDRATEPAIIWKDQEFSYEWMIKAIEDWTVSLESVHIPQSSVVSLIGDCSPSACALLLALTARNCVIVPLSSAVESSHEEFMDIAEVQHSIRFAADDSWHPVHYDRQVENSVTRRLLDEDHPGLVLFSSGSTGKSKAALHDFQNLLEKFKVRRHSLRTLVFLLLDHIGGINTLLYTMSNGGTIVTTENRDPDVVSAAIERHKVQLLPTSPTFLNMLLLSGAYERHDLSSLDLISYGTEVMHESTLNRVNKAFPGVRLLQTYGLSELGILRSQSKSSESMWVRVGGEGFDTKIVDNKLWIRAESAMLGYLNAPSPFDDDGWFNTGDSVEVDGDYLRILGRESEIINVGGQKVFPAEIESVLMRLDNVRDVIVVGEANAITGQIVMARFNLIEEEKLGDFRRRVRKFCAGEIEPYKVPAKIEVVEDRLFSDRFKKMRRLGSNTVDSNIS